MKSELLDVELLQFFRDYNQLLELQLRGVRTLIALTFDQASAEDIAAVQHSKAAIAIVNGLRSNSAMNQRLDHVLDAMQLMGQALQKLATNPAGTSHDPGVSAARINLLSDIYRKYSLPEERETFHKVFGRPT